VKAILSGNIDILHIAFDVADEATAKEARRELDAMKEQKGKAEEGEAADAGEPAMAAPALPKSSTTFTPKVRRKMIVETLELMLSWFGGDAVAMWQALDEHRPAAEEQKGAEEAPREGALH
jgi:hypothetical protein